MWRFFCTFDRQHEDFLCILLTQAFLYLSPLHVQDTMDQSMGNMNGTAMVWNRMMLDYPKVQTQAYVESKPKRQRPTHQGKFWVDWYHFGGVSIIKFSLFRPGRLRDSMERSGTKTKDPVQLQKRLGLFSGVALIVGTMIGKF